MPRSLKIAVVLGLCCWCGISATAGAADEGPQIRFRKTKIDDQFHSEGVAVGDFNHDGQLDIAAGDVYFAAPDWKSHRLRSEPRVYDPLHYSNSFCNFADDINGDGWDDLIVVDFPGKETWWLENPKSSDAPWTPHVIAPVTNNESPSYLDVDGDGQREMVMGTGPSQAKPDDPQRHLSIFSRPDDVTQLWNEQVVSEDGVLSAKKFSHGIGAGDINGDGRNDIVTTEGWWESPKDAAKSPWKFHAAAFGEPCAHMHVDDFDGDGDSDVLSSSAHAYGVWWHEQTPEGWKSHEIATDFSQTHSLCVADINGDGLNDFVTGKRWWAHGPKGDVGAGEPAVLYWFERTTKKGAPTWVRHTIDEDSGVGTQFEVRDINGDGLLDVAVSNKQGVFCFEQIRE